MKRSFRCLYLSLILASSLPLKAETVVYVSESGDKRIAIYSLDEQTGALTLKDHRVLPGAPGSLAMSADKKHLYAAVRTEKKLATLPVDPATRTLGEPILTPASVNAAYVHVDKTRQWLLAASYSEGVATVSKIENGIITGAPVCTVNTGLKAHSIQTDAANRFAFIPHVGELNKVEQLKFDAQSGQLTSNDPPHLPGGPGEGPRHFAFHPNGRWAYFVNEQGKCVTLCDYDAEKGTLKARGSVSTVPDEWKTKGSCADIHVTADGRFVYASNRGHDSLAAFAVNQESGELTSLGQTPTEKTPRSFGLTPGDRFIISAGEGSHQLIVYRRDATSGKLEPLKTYPCGKGPAWVIAVKF